MREGIHNYDGRLACDLKRLDRSGVSSVNKGFILSFYNYLLANGMSKARIDRYLQALKMFGELVSKSFSDLSKDDVVSLIGVIESRCLTQWTKYTYKSMFRKFIQWLLGGDEVPAIVKWIKLNCSTKKRLPEEILSQDEVKRLIEASDNSRNKALISLLYESGCRVGEVGNLKLKHVRFDNYGAQLIVNGKTGQRRVRVISSVSYLADWLSKHPGKGDPESPLWVSLWPNKGSLIDYACIRKLIKVVARKAGVSKRVNPHSFRHARATHLSNHLTEAQMKEYFGWTQGSDMASVYIHLSGRDVDKALLKVNGIIVDKESSDDAMSIINCSRCGFINAPTNKYCGKCGLVLNVKEALQLEQEERNKDYLLNELIKDPVVKELLQAKAQAIMKTK